MASSVIKNRNPVLREMQFLYSIPASSTYNTNLKTKIDDDLPSGYKFDGLIGYATNNVNVIVTNFGYYDSQYSLQMVNRTASALNNITFRLFYRILPQ